MEIFCKNKKILLRYFLEKLKLIGFIFKKRLFLQHILKTKNYDI